MAGDDGLPGIDNSLKRVACEMVEGNTYSPMGSLNRDYFVDSETTPACHWKGTAAYLTVRVNGEDNPDAA
jgi:uncharacterized protein (DUF427 family)